MLLQVMKITQLDALYPSHNQKYNKGLELSAMIMKKILERTLPRGYKNKQMEAIDSNLGKILHSPFKLIKKPHYNLHSSSLHKTK
tara:strand:+ start:1809 stop:2063 length:255 start_codon:yes stop_codon:yes gene_type:complete